MFICKFCKKIFKRNCDKTSHENNYCPLNEERKNILVECSFCKKKIKKTSKKYHEDRCYSNINRVSGTFKGKSHSEEAKKKQGRYHKSKNPESILDVSKRTVSKILRRMNCGCLNCGWNESSCDIHHIVPRCKNGSNDNDNLTILCPNCHRLAHTGKISNFLSIAKKLGDSWKEFYYSHN